MIDKVLILDYQVDGSSFRDLTTVLSGWQVCSRAGYQVVNGIYETDCLKWYLPVHPDDKKHWSVGCSAGRAF
jgi:hypothetical protein